MKQICSLVLFFYLFLPGYCSLRAAPVKENNPYCDPWLKAWTPNRNVKLIPDNPVVLPELYNGNGLGPRDREKNELYKLARLLDDAGYLPAGGYWLPVDDYSKLGTFRLGEVLNTSGRFLKPEDVDQLLANSPLFKFNDLGNGQIDLVKLHDPDVRYPEDAIEEKIFTMDLGSLSGYGLINITQNPLPLFQREYVAFHFFYKDGQRILRAFHVMPGAVDHTFSIKFSLVPRSEEMLGRPTRVFFRTDKVRTINLGSGVPSHVPIYSLDFTPALGVKPKFLRVPKK